MPNSLWLHGLYSPWDSLGQNTGVGSLSLLQGISTTQGLNPGLLHCRQILYQLSHKGSSAKVKVILEDNGPLIQHDWSLYQRRLFREFPGGPWLQPPSAEGWGLIPGQGTRIPHAATKDPTCHNYDLAQTKYISNFKKRKETWIHTHTTPCEDETWDWCDVSTTQRMLRMASRAPQVKRVAWYRSFPPERWKEQILQHLSLELPACRLWDNTHVCCLSPPACDALL